MKRPFLALWISYMLGIYLYHNYQIDMENYKVLLMLSGSFFVLTRFILNRKGYALALVFTMLLGGYLYASDYKLESIELGGVEDLEGVIIEERNREDGYERYLLRLSGEGYSRKNRVILLTFYENTQIEVGDRLLLDGEASEFRENTNPKLFNQKNYYKSQYIHAGLISKKEHVHILGRKQLSWAGRMSHRFRERVEDVMDTWLEQGQADLLKSMILGKSSYMGSEELSTFRELGLGHMIAVSGLHIGILYGAVMLILSKLLGLHKRTAELISLSVIGYYIMLIGAPVSSIRAGLMIGLYLLGKLLVKRADMINVISAVGLLMILYRPLWILSVGYSLSFAGIMVIAIALAHKRNPTASVIIGLAPLNVYYFNVVPLISVVSNLIMAPLLSLVLVMGMGMLVLSYLSLGALAIVASLVGGLLYVNELSISTISELYSTVYMRTPELYELVFAYLVIAVIIGAVDIRAFDKRLLKCFLGYTLLASLILVMYPRNDLVEVDFLDVGQGDCAILKISDKTYMIDSGGSIFSQYDVGERVVYPYLLKHGLTDIDAFIVSHFHADHMKGFLHFADRVNVGEIIIGHRNQDNKLYKSLMELAEREEIPVRQIEFDTSHRLDRDNVLYFLPASESIQRLNDENNNSLLVLVESFEKRLLFTGDIEKERESDIQDKLFLSDIDVLKVPHHGSPTSSTEEFLNLTRPRHGVIQVGRNRYGHPSSEVLSRYQDFGTELYRNDLSGMIKLSLRRNDYEIEEYLKEKKTPLEAIMNFNLEILLILLQIGLWLIILQDYRDLEELHEL